MTTLLNLTAGERIDLTDFAYVAQDAPLDILRATPSLFLTDPKKQAMHILRGFTLSSPTGQVLTVTKGAALLSLRKGTRVLQGIVTGDGQDTLSVDLSGYAAATYTVYIRFVLNPGSYDTRTFFRAASGGQEYAQSVPTRLEGQWEVQVATVLPGAEWLGIGTVTTPSMALVDKRPLYFEGRVDLATVSNWGTVNDRSDDRGAYGLGDLQTALSAVRQSLEDIKGPGIARWYSDHVAGQTIGYKGTFLNGRTSWGDDSFYAQGNGARPSITFGADNAHIAYVRASGLLVATGPELGSNAQSVGSSLSFRSGADNALVRGGFYRATAGAGSAGIDGSLTRGPAGTATGGLGLYGAQGVMGAAGVGLGYALGGQVPALFVNSNNQVGIGHPNAQSLSQTAAYALQLNAAANAESYLSFNEAGTPRFWLGYANNAVITTGGAAFTGGVVSITGARRLAFTQAGVDYAALVGGSWVFGQGAITRNITRGAVNIASTQNPVSGTSTDAATGTQVTNYNPGTSLLINNDGVSASLNGQPLPARLSFASSGSDVFYVDGGALSFGVRDVFNGIDVMRYSTTSKLTLFGGTLRAVGYQLSPTLTHVDTVLGNRAVVYKGTQQSTTAVGQTAFCTIASAQASVFAALPLATQAGQTVQSVTVTYTCNSPVSNSVILYVSRYDAQADTNQIVNVTTTILAANQSGLQSITVPIASIATSTNNSWYATLTSSNSGTDYTLVIKAMQVTLQSTVVGPQRQ